MRLQELLSTAICRTEVIRVGESKYKDHYVLLAKEIQGIESYYQVYITDMGGEHILQSADAYDTYEEAEKEYKAHLLKERQDEESGR